MLQQALNMNKKKGSHSLVKEAKKFAREIDLDFETEFDGGDEEHGKCSKVEKNC